MDKIITNYDYDLEKFYYDDEINIADTKSKIKIFRAGEGFKYNRIFLKTPRMRLAFDPNNNRFNNITLSLHPLTEEIRTFYNFIKNIDKLNKKKILEIVDNKKIKYKSNIIKKKNTNFRYITFNLSNNCKIFNDKRELAALSDLSIQNDVKLLIELNHIWIKDNRCGTSWEVYQIKYYPFLIDLDDCFILSDDDEDEVKNTKKNDFKHLYKCINCSSEFYTNDNSRPKSNIPPYETTPTHQSAHVPASTPIQSSNSISKVEINKTTSKPLVNVGFRPPSVKDLLNMKNKLKKPNPIEE